MSKLSRPTSPNCITRDAAPPGCISCGERDGTICPNSQMPCGHHCNHGWTHDECCWCGGRWGEAGAFTPGTE